MPDSGNAFKKAQQQAIKRLRSSRQQEVPTEVLAAQIRNGSQSALSKGITWVESNHPETHARGQHLVSLLYPHSGKSFRIGITGVPGVGKSTFIEAFGKLLITEKHQVAVLAIDPSSQKSHGSILGDKTRMEELSVNPQAFIRPSPSSMALGGVARSTREAMILCEAAGFDIIFIETVGVGQSEVAVHSMTDFFLLLMLPGAGDELQGIKRGIMEMADLVVINKSEGANRETAEKARRAYNNALHLFPPNSNGWIPKVRTCSALKNEGLDKLWEIITQYRSVMNDSGFIQSNRAKQSLYWFRSTIDNLWHQYLSTHPTLGEHKTQLEKQVADGTMSPFEAAGKLMEHLQNS